MSIWTARVSGDTNIRPNDHRDPYQRDRARILHSAAFRRLQSKTQIMEVGQNDFYRTRLTHSLEVAQIGTGLTAQLKQCKQVKENETLQQLIPSDALIESLCLAHDIGHPPFGHGGEVALNYMMKNSGGFEGNGQTFRIMTKLEPYTKDFGMDLTRRTLLGLVKYPQLLPNSLTNSNEHTTASNIIKASDWKPIKGLFQDDIEHFKWLLKELDKSDRDWFLQTDKLKSKHKSFDASIMEIADDIAYGVHDLEDAIVLNKVTKKMWLEQALPVLKSIPNQWSMKHAEQLTDMLFSEEHYQRKNAIGALVNHLITNIEIKLCNDNIKEPLLAYNASLTEHVFELLKILKSFVYKNVIQATEIQQLEFKGQRMLISMFEAFNTDPERLLPSTVYSNWLKAQKDNGNTQRIICDYLASMSDEQAHRSYQLLFNGGI